MPALIPSMPSPASSPISTVTWLGENLVFPGVGPAETEARLRARRTPDNLDMAGVDLTSDMCPGQLINNN